LYTQMNFSWLYTFTGFDINATVNTKTSPILYCGGIAVVLVVYLFFDKRINIKTRIASALFFVFMTLGFCFKEFELMWTAFVESHSYNFRFAFVFAFVMIMLSAMTIREIQNNENKINKKALLQALALIGAVVLVHDLTNNYQNRFVSTVYAVGYAIYAVLAIGIYNGENLKKKVQWKKLISVAVVALLICAELGVNSLLAYKDYNFSNSGFSSYTEEMSAVVDELKSEDNSFYRFEKNYSYLSQLGSDVATCDALMFNYNSIEHYSSTYDGNVDEFMASMGYSDSTNIPDENSDEDIVFPTDTYWNSPMLLMESLLGVKYELWQDNLDYLEKMNMQSTVSGGYAVYKNPYALPLAYNVSSNIEVKPEYGLNPFENQQMLLSSMLGEKIDVYVNPDIKLTSIENDIEKYTLRANANGPVYLYSDGSQEHSNRYINNCELYVNGVFVQKMCSRFNYNAVYLGSYDKGDEVTVEIKRISKESKAHSGEHTIYTAQLDMNRFEDAYNALSGGFETDLNVNGNTVSGKYTTDKNSTVMFTLPYTEGWTVYVDGVKAEYKELAGTFIGIDLTAGTHSVEMKYKTPYINVGIAATFIGVAGVVLWSVAELFLSRKKKKTA
ncbi:MAG: YfhO family protein, partial [Eubacterium sp.]|nr:YfhO family protein [Eubacterium sp.]